MGRINSIGSWFEKTVGGFIFGTQNDKITVTGNIGLEGAITPGFEYTFPPKTGIVALTDDINYLTGTTFNTGNGIITHSMLTGNTITVDLDGRYGLESNRAYTYSATQRIIPRVGTFTNTSNYGTISGGDLNTISGGTHSFIGGGLNNTASGTYSTVTGGQDNIILGNYGSAISGGRQNTVSGYYSTVSGGYNNTVSGFSSVIGGGDSNSISGAYSYMVIGGGSSNTSSGYASVIAGGLGNDITASRTYSTISGGRNNTISGGTYVTIAGGKDNKSAGGYSSILGGFGNTGTTLSLYSTTSGYQNTNNAWGGTAMGYKNNISNTLSGAFGDTNTVDGYGAFAFGQGNNITTYTSFSGGYNNTISGGTVNTAFGWGNVLNSGGSSFVTGQDNNVSEYAGGGGYNFVGGYSNTVTTNYGYVGGYNNVASGWGHTIFGVDNTSNNSIGYTFSSGRNHSNRGVGMNTLGLALAGASVGTTILGQANIDYTGTIGSPNTATDPILLVGNGSINSGSLTANVRSNAFSVLLNGTVTAPSITNALINTAGAKSLVSKEWVEANYTTSTGSTTGTVTNVNSGNGMTFTNFTTSGSIILGTPSTITDSSTNSVSTNSHTHAIDHSSTSIRGIVQLNDTLTSTSTTIALTANMGKSLQDTKANLASPIFTGNPTAPTPSTGDNDTSIATTAFVKAQNYSSTVGTVLSVTGGVGITQTGTISTTPTINIDYLGTDNFMWSAPLLTNPLTSDYIIYHDVTDNNVKRALVSSLPFSNNSGDITRVNITAGTGLTGSVDTTSGDHTQTLNHSNSISAGNFGDSEATRILTFGDTFKNEYVTYDAQGHITAATTKTLTLPTIATSTVAGFVELFSNTDNPTAANAVSSTALRTYGIQLNTANQMVVNVPWTNTQNSYTATLTAGTGLAGATYNPSTSTTFSLDFSELTDMTADIAGTTEFILQNGTTESRKAASEIKLSNFNNDSGWTSNIGDITGVTAGVGLSGGGTSGTVSLALDFGELGAGGTLIGTDYLLAENGGVDNRQLISSIPLGIFNNDQGWTSDVNVNWYLSNITHNATDVLFTVSGTTNRTLNAATSSLAGVVSNTTQTFGGNKTFFGTNNFFGTAVANTAKIKMNTANAGSPQITITDNFGDMTWALGGDDGDNSFKIHGNGSATEPIINNLAIPHFEITTAGETIITDKITVGDTQSNLGANSSILGGASNQITTSRTYSTIAGGQSNVILGGTHSFIGGGSGNIASGYYSIVGGGKTNNITTSRNYSFIGGGELNVISGGTHSVISGGYNNTLSGNKSVIGGGLNNTASGYNRATVAGGDGNTASANYSTIGGGIGNNASGPTSTIAGGLNNTSSGTYYSFVGGGEGNTASGGYGTTIAGGRGNSASAYLYSTISGGYNNSVSGYYSSILGGQSNNMTHQNSHAIGSNLTSTQTDTTFIEKLYIKSLLNQSSEATALVINSSKIVGYRELGTAAFLPDSNVVHIAGTETITGSKTFNAGLTIGTSQVLNHNATSSRDKLRVWTSSSYSIGMQSANNFGALSDYAMTFQMSNTANRGWLWVDDAHSTSQGAMSVTTDGRAAIATNLKVGYGESDTTAATEVVDVKGGIKTSDGTNGCTMEYNTTSATLDFIFS